MKKVQEDIILGIDPGTTIMGYGLIKAGKQPEVLQLGVLHLRKYASHYQKLHTIFDTTQRIIKEYKPVICAIEAPFFGKNVQSMLKLGRAQGTAIAAAVSLGVDVVEYSPKKIKAAVTGNGNASKEQVAGMLKRILKGNTWHEDIPLDATDGLAAAVCHYYQKQNRIGNQKAYSDWSDFIKNNPKKLKKR